MSMSSPGEAPDQEAKPCQREHHTDDMSLLRLQVVLKLETDERNDASEHQRSRDVTERGQSTHLHNP